jgi:hypothetical protein
MWEQVQETVGYINKINNFNPEYGVILVQDLVALLRIST